MPSWSTSSIPVQVKNSPSLIYNNLSFSSSSTAFAHVSEILLVKLGISAECRKIQHKDMAIITQVKFISYKKNEYLIMTTDAGFEMWEPNKLQVIHIFTLSSEVESQPADTVLYCCGIAMDEKNGNIVVGSSIGTMYLFKFEKNKVSLLKHLPGHRKAVTCISTSLGCILSGSSDGTIIIWDANDKHEIRRKISNDSSCSVTSLVTHQEVAVASYLSGHIRGYRISSGNIAFEISAHCRAITAMDLHGTYLASVGEDTFLNVWNLPDYESKQTSEVKLLFSERVKEEILTGVCFTNNGDLLTSTYDKEILRQFTFKE